MPGIGATRSNKVWDQKGLVQKVRRWRFQEFFLDLQGVPSFCCCLALWAEYKVTIGDAAHGEWLSNTLLKTAHVSSLHPDMQ